MEPCPIRSDRIHAGSACIAVTGQIKGKRIYFFIQGAYLALPHLGAPARPVDHEQGRETFTVTGRAFHEANVQIFQDFSRGGQRHLSPPDEGAAPGQTATEDREANKIIFLDAAIADRLIEGDSAGSGGYISIFMECHVKPFHG